ncbi:beta-glucan synthesis-associated protein [Saxophila tyrrhenica]|uniref:Beta-glucan synthesis-associated protein n=1 Tax=Saxophila tyrrhenica TaxID=1690608 RepID=A0AAV9PPG5_9PEZI|nr:beta-glucan synthesis-associated protein [Saxophila tyrrhenica]
MDPGGPPPQRHGPPHIRLNSGSDDLLQNGQQNAQTAPERPQTSRQPSSRSLTSQSQQQQRPGTAPGRPPTAGSTGGSTGVYQSHTPADSHELLLPPRKSKSARKFRDEDSPLRSPMSTGFNSRRTSWSSGSDASRDSRIGAYANPFEDSRAPSRAGSDDEGVNTQTVSEKYNILPSAGLLLFPEDVEKDDWLHTPDPNDRDKMNCADLFSKRGMMNVGGLALITLGILVLFIVYPILTFVQGALDPGADLCTSDPMCIHKKVPLLQNVRTGLVDPDTPDSVKQRKGANGNTQTLVFSDEFNTPGRTFYDNDDPYWQAVDIWYGATQDLEWYDPDAATTQDGYLALRFDAFKNHNLNYRSGMLQSWNKMCFKGGYMEASISLPGKGDTAGFWPGFWAMGNLGRPGYLATTDGMWPYSYDHICDAGITVNQSDPDGLNYLPGMRLPACTCRGEDHPNPGYSRSAPEIDALEAQIEYMKEPYQNAIGGASQSIQIAPFDLFWRPNPDWQEIYDYSVTHINFYQGGPFQEAVSAVTTLNNNWYDGNEYQLYGFDYTPGADGQVVWNVGDDHTWKVTGKSLGPNGNVGQRTIPEEPLTLIVNFGMSDSFSAINWTGIAPLLPATMRVDYVRIYQDEDGEMTCDPEGFPTTDYIAKHPAPYKNPNMTHWEDAHFQTPQNSLVNGCKAANYDGDLPTKRAKRSVKKSKRNSSKRSWFSWS